MSTVVQVTLNLLQDPINDLLVCLGRHLNRRLLRNGAELRIESGALRLVHVSDEGVVVHLGHVLVGLAAVEVGHDVSVDFVFLVAHLRKYLLELHVRDLAGHRVVLSQSLLLALGVLTLTLDVDVAVLEVLLHLLKDHLETLLIVGRCTDLARVKWTEHPDANVVQRAKPLKLTDELPTVDRRLVLAIFTKS